MFPSVPKRQRYLFACFVLASYLGATYGSPIDVPREKGLIARQATTTTSTAVQTSTTRTTSRSTTVSETTSSAVTSTTSTTSSSTTTTSTTSSSQQTSTTSTSSESTTTSATSTTSSTSSSSSTSTSTTASASATSSSSSSILSKSSPYFGYAVGVLVVVSLFGLLLVVLIIRFIVQKFSKKPEPQQQSKAGAWRYSQDTELYSPGTTHNQSTNVAGLGARHKEIGSEMGEREAFLSTESVALYPAAKEDRYTDADATHRAHSRSLSDSSQSTATPFVNRRPASMAFLHSPPATHPAFVVDQASQNGHSQEHALGAVPEAPQEREPGPRSMPSLVMARAAHSDPFRQQTTSSAGVSRAASTASAYSQPSATRTDTPPLPVLLSAFAQPEPEVSPDVSAALSTLQAQNPSTDTIHTNELGTNPPPTTESHGGEQPTLRQTPGRLALSGQAPTSIHSHADLFFDHSHSR